MSELVRQTISRYALPLAFAACAALSLVLFVEYFVVGKFMNDFGVYWRTANQPVELAYHWPGRFPFPYMPTMLLWITPLSALPLGPAYLGFAALSVAAFILACRPFLPRAAILLALVSPPFVRSLYTGQVTIILAALLLWACATNRRVVAGIAFGIIASIKPQLVVMAPLMMALNRDWKAFVFAGLTFLISASLSVEIYGLERWPEWIASMAHFRSAVTDTNIIGISTAPAAIAVRVGFPPLPFLIAGILAGALTIYLCRKVPPLEQAAAIGIGSILAAPYALVYDLVTVIPFLALAIMQGRVLAVLGILGTVQPIPLAVSVLELLHKVMWHAKTKPPSLM